MSRGKYLHFIKYKVCFLFKPVFMLQRKTSLNIIMLFAYLNFKNLNNFLIIKINFLLYHQIVNNNNFGFNYLPVIMSK